MTKKKMIKYRGGIAEFAIPSHWHEEYEPEGGGTFYADSPDSGTLRLNVISCVSKDTPAEQIAAIYFRDGTVKTTNEGFPLRRREKAVEEDGERLHIVSWKVAIPVPPKSLRVALFTYTILKKQKDDPPFIAEMQELERSIEQSSFSQEPGVSGDYGQA
jgi:hypothetical protein